MKKLCFSLLAVCLIGIACDEIRLEDSKTNDTSIICDADDPLVDITWLMGKIDEINLLAQENQNLSIAIYQCVYGSNETGFLIDEGNTKPFYNCSGDVLCIMGGFAGETCSELNIVSQELIWEKNYFAEIPRIECAHEDDYMDIIGIEGIGYLFRNTVPAELQKDDDVMYITYNEEDNLVTFSAAYPMDALYNGNICNFPDFAKEWEIPAEGKQIYYKGELNATGIYWSEPPHIGGDLILTILKTK